MNKKWRGKIKEKKISQQSSPFLIDQSLNIIFIEIKYLTTTMSNNYTCDKKNYQCITSPSGSMSLKECAQKCQPTNYDACAGNMTQAHIKCEIDDELIQNFRR